MAEGKYGRLFTDDDIRKLAARWLGDRAMGPDIMAETLDELDRAGEFTFPADEPLFLLRGQDRAAGLAVLDYHARARAARGVGRYGEDAFSNAVLFAAKEMRAWQLANPDRVKVPD